MVDRISSIREEALAEIQAAATKAELEEIRVRYLGRKSELTSILRGISDLEPAERGPVGKAGNEVRGSLEETLGKREEELAEKELEERLARDSVDVTMPGSPMFPVGHHHLISATIREIEDIMVGLGYRVVEGPEIEHDYYNFTALNHPPGHPARQLQDTFYIDPHSLAEVGGADSGTEPEVLLRTHTSPVQIRAMEAQGPPIFVIAPGKVYRRDSDATHTPMFHQIEGLAVAAGITLADLEGTLLVMLKAIFGPERNVRMRPHFFPFTEPSVEFDVSCFKCSGSGALDDDTRCNLCKGIGWIEVGGAGMVDPNVLDSVAEFGYDSGEVQGFAFGMGVERIAMLRHGIPDLRRFFENDVRVLGQFS